MRSLHDIGRFAAGACALVVLAGAAPSAPEQYTIRLGPLPMSDATKPKMRGAAQATVTLEGGTRAVVKGTFTGLSGPATTAELRSGDGIGVPGPAIGSLAVTQAAAGDLSGEAKLTSAQVKALRSGRVYVQINSQASPEGNLWGWALKPQPTALVGEAKAGQWFLPQIDMTAAAR